MKGRGIDDDDCAISGMVAFLKDVRCFNYRLFLYSQYDISHSLV